MLIRNGEGYGRSFLWLHGNSFFFFLLMFVCKFFFFFSLGLLSGMRTSAFHDADIGESCSICFFIISINILLAVHATKEPGAYLCNSEVLVTKLKEGSYFFLFFYWGLLVVSLRAYGRMFTSRDWLAMGQLGGHQVTRLFPPCFWP